VTFYTPTEGGIVLS